MTTQFTRIAFCVALSVILVVSCAVALRQKSLRQHHAAWQLKQFGVILRVDDDRLEQDRFDLIFFGDDSYSRVRSIEFTRDLPSDLLPSVCQLYGAKKIFIHNCDNADRILSSITCMSSVESVSVTDSILTREGVQAIAEFRDLSTLNLIELRQHPEGLESLSLLQNLQTVCLNGANVTDSTLKSLDGIDSLRNLTIWNSTITDEGVRDFRQHHPLEQLTIHLLSVKPRQ